MDILLDIHEMTRKNLADLNIGYQFYVCLVEQESHIFVQCHMRGFSNLKKVIHNTRQCCRAISKVWKWRCSYFLSRAQIGSVRRSKKVAEL